MDGERAKGVFAQFKLLPAKERREVVKEICTFYAPLVCEEIKKAAKCWCAKLTGERRKNK